MAEVSFFPKYKQHENQITNHTLLILKQVYNESPFLFQELIADLTNDGKIKIGVSFEQQVGEKLSNSKSVIDGCITQQGFKVFVETKSHDWFYSEQLEKYCNNLLDKKYDKIEKKILLTLSNFDGIPEPKNFKQIKNKYFEKNIIIKRVEFEDLCIALNKISDKVKSDILTIMIKEYEQYLNQNNLLPVWRYRMEVPLCSKSKEYILENSVYLCPEAKGAYKHQRAKYFGIYANKKVDTVAEIKAVCAVSFDGKEIKDIDISWCNNADLKKEEIEKEVSQKVHNAIENNVLNGEPVQIFLLDNFRKNINFVKETPRAPQGKRYFYFNDVNDIDELCEKIKNQSW